MTASGEFDTRPVRAFLPGPDLQVDASAWPASVPALAQVLREGLELPAGLTVLVGENGSGKSTVVETLAEAYGLNPQGGSALGQSFRIRESEPGVGGDLIVVRGVRPRWSYFLRADTMHQLYTYLEQNPGKSDDPWHQLSHGEGFLEILRTRVNQTGFYLMDEPDAPLSFTSLLGTGGAAARPGRGRFPAGRRHPLPRPRGRPRGERARARAVGHPARELGRPQPGGGLAAVHA